MAKVNAVCTYDSTTNTIFNLSFIRRNGDNIQYIYGNNKTEKPVFPSFFDLYKTILKIAKQNNHEIPFCTEFNAKLYNIYFIDINNPGMMHRYYLKEEN